MQKRKILIIGTSGCGKTTLGKMLSKRFHLPHIDLDEIHWLPDWIERDKEDFREQVKKVLQENSEWILSGNYSRVADLTWPSADLIIWLDYPLATLLYRVIKRTIQNVALRRKCCNGNQETLPGLFSRKSIAWWVLSTYRRRKRTYRTFFEKENNPEKCVRICSNKELKHFLATL